MKGVGAKSHNRYGLKASLLTRYLDPLCHIAMVSDTSNVPQRILVCVFGACIEFQERGSIPAQLCG